MKGKLVCFIHIHSYSVLCFGAATMWCLIMVTVLGDAVWNLLGVSNLPTEWEGVILPTYRAGKDRRHSSGASEGKDTVHPWVGTFIWNDKLQV